MNNDKKINTIENVQMETEFVFKKDFDIEKLIDLKKKEINQFIEKVNDSMNKTS